MIIRVVLRLDVRLPLPSSTEACRPRDVTCFSLLRTSWLDPAPRAPAPSQPCPTFSDVHCALLRVYGVACPDPWPGLAPGLLLCRACFRAPPLPSLPPSPKQGTGLQPSLGTLRVPAASPQASTRNERRIGHRRPGSQARACHPFNVRGHHFTT